ncbi:hypothetical protein ElyMa_002051100 [Elysia marginata]|uniref:Uncharacterized protein n=1 Tax=Elysia marginata TaxID=1093978 RepID=A0AAV4F8S2_9GAST|nr:hypothetical protein ElyMa_002051100 [Elysia marginata]
METQFPCGCLGHNKPRADHSRWPSLKGLASLDNRAYAERPVFLGDQSGHFRKTTGLLFLCMRSRDYPEMNCGNAGTVLDTGQLRQAK